jgi:very-short-patch-repair endonuclease
MGDVEPEAGIPADLGASEAAERRPGPQVGSEELVLQAEIRAQIGRRITWATQQNDVPVIGEIVLANPGTESLEDLTLRLACDPPVLGERFWRISSIAPGGELSLFDRRVTLAGGLLAKIDERMRAELTLELRKGETVLAEHRREIVALAHNEWGGGRHMPELLAAFVVPNDPAVARLLKDASGILRAAGCPGALEGYQSKSRARAWEIVSALWTAVVRRGLTYVEPPASFESEGQKIRLPSAVETQGLATCLDTAVLFAAAIEEAGLNPVIVFTEGHALAGAWLQPKSLPSLAVEDVVDLRKAVDQSELVLFETTLACADRPVAFSDAVREARRQIDEAQEARFVFALDVKRARAQGIMPLPSASEAGEGPAAGAEARAEAALEETPDLPPFEAETDARDTLEMTPAERLDRWKRSLLDLSKRNRLLNLKTSASALPIFCPDIATLEDMIAQDARIAMIPPPPQRTAEGAIDPTLRLLRQGEDLDRTFAEEALARGELVVNADAKTLEKGSIELYRKAKADFEEGGSNTLYLALGMLRWTPAGSKTAYRAPMVMLPVRLERRSAASKPKIARHEDDPVFNLTLLEMLRQDFQLTFPELEKGLPRDGHGVDIRRVWSLVRARVRDVPGFEVVEEVVLSTFSFAKYLMWKDLADRTETLKTAPFVRHVIDTPRDVYAGGASFLEPNRIDREIDPAALLAPLNADSSQIVAIHASGEQGDFVLEGPPGTGKSETIGNIIAHNLGLGRRVLFVSEKMAALDVVHDRLKKAGLGDFCLELHSARANKRAVLAQLDEAWSNRSERSTEEWERRARKLGAMRESLNGLAAALHAPGPGGISARDAIGRTMRFGDVHRLRLDWPHDPSGRGHAPDPEALEALETLARRLGLWFAQLEPADLAAFHDVHAAEFSNHWRGEVEAAALDLGRAVADLVACRSAFATSLSLPDAGPDPEESAAIAAIAGLVPDCAAVDLRFALDPEGPRIIEALRRAGERLSAYRERKATLQAPCADDRIAAAPLDAWVGELAEANAKIWPLAGMTRKKLRVAMRVALDLPASVAEPERDLSAWRALSELRSEMGAIVRDLSGPTPWRGLQTEEEALARALRCGARLREAATRLASFGGRDPIETRRLLARRLCEGRDLLEAGMPIAVLAKALAAAHATFEDRLARFRSLSRREGQETASDADLATLARAAEALVERAPRLRIWCEWVAVSREARALGLGALIVALEAGAVGPDEAPEAFRTAYARWVAPILVDLRPELRRFSTVTHEALIADFRTLDAELARLASETIRAKLSGSAPAKHAVGESDPRYGVLARELRRKQAMPVRQLVSEMGSALTALTPCLLMSPLSVAQFLPADAEPFDLVVFDEASQITVPDAIGAIARGRRCIVVGDPKQMPPTRFFEREASDGEEEGGMADLESILDEAMAARLPHHRLTGHYRSRHESLICFSNHAYYGGQLVTYPAADTRDTVVFFRRVAGVYARGKARTNPIEAQAVVAEVVRRLRDPVLSRLSLGVVTFNVEQQRLIEDLLDAERRADPGLERHFDGAGGDAVFVKNLETVQGDQRDVILISVGYGPTEPGAQTMPMNFGPLNKQGGERRLNVAITRATTEVGVFASFDPGMIDLTRSQAAAVRDLKTYLDFAARGTVALGEAVRRAGTEDYANDFEQSIAEMLRAKGWSVRTQIGVSKFSIDLGIVHPDAPGRFLAGVECDGATYHSSPSARDRDRVRHLVLENLGWRLFRVWSTDFFNDPEGAMNALDGKLSALLEKDRAEAEALLAEAEPEEVAGEVEAAEEAADEVVVAEGRG